MSVLHPLDPPPLKPLLAVAAVWAPSSKQSPLPVSTGEPGGRGVRPPPPSPPPSPLPSQWGLDVVAALVDPFTSLCVLSEGLNPSEGEADLWPLHFCCSRVGGYKVTQKHCGYSSFRCTVAFIKNFIEVGEKRTGVSYRRRFSHSAYKTCQKFRPVTVHHVWI